MKIDKSFFIKLSFGFIIATILGTLNHEFGHYFVAYYLGYKPHLSYGYCTYDYTLAKPYYDQYDDFYISLGGPMQTMLSGSIGLMILIIKSRKYFTSKCLTFYQWVVIYLTLFWLRQSSNFTIYLIQKILYNTNRRTGDEFLISDHLGINPFYITGGSAFIGFVILAMVVFYFIPKSQRLTFVLSGLVGGVLGFLIWLEYIGPILMP